MNPLFTNLFQQIIGVEFVYFNQTNSLNRRDRTLSITAFNESFSSRVEVKEHCYYSVSIALTDFRKRKKSAEWKPGSTWSVIIL